MTDDNAAKNIIRKKPMQKLIVIPDFPFPPSENNCYRNNSRGGRCKSKGYRDYETMVDQWAMLNLNNIRRARQSIEFHNHISIEAQMGFATGRIFTKDGRPKKIDVSNFVKVMHDCLAKLLAFDDKNVWFFSARKCEVGLGESQRVHLVIKPVKHERFFV